MVYDVLITTVEVVERPASGHIKRWLALPLSLCCARLYSFEAQLQLPLTSITEENVVINVRQLLMLRDSKDAKE